jgi:thiopurine S-methyltransferase
MESEFWINKWIDNDIRFHQSKYHPQLERFGARFSPGTILVPLCGKTLDMLFLSSLGHSVIGVELSPIACRDFFIENGISYTEKVIPDFTVYESEFVTIWCGDFFKLPEEVWKKVTGVYDRAALVALPTDIRSSYVRDFAKRGNNVSEILLISFEYPQSAMSGPPFSIPENEVKNLYPDFEIEKIHVGRETRTSKEDPNSNFEFTESVYWFRKK